MLAHDDIGFAEADILGPHDLEGLGIFQHPVLVDARFMGKGVFADDRFVKLYREAGNRGDAARDVHDLGRIDASGEGHNVVADLHRHHDLFQRRIARAFAQAVDGALNLPRAAFDSRQRVGRRHAQIIMAMGGENHLIRARDLGDQPTDQLGGFVRGGIANRVGNVDGGRPGLDRNLDHAGEVIPLGPGRVHRAPLHIVAEVPRMGHGVVDALGHLILGQVGDRAVQWRGADEGVDAGLLGMAHGLPTAVDILVIRARQAADHAVLGILRDLGDGGEIALRCDWETGFDDIDAHIVQETRDLQFLFMAHGCARGLLAIAQGGVENHHAVFVSVHWFHLIK